MEGLPEQLASTTNTIMVVVHQPSFLFAAIAVFFVLLAAAAVYRVVSSPVRARREVEGLVQELDMMTKKLSEAEHIGNFGSFTWDFENPAASFWSEEMYILCGLVPRKKPPLIDTFIDIAHQKDREIVRAALEKVQEQPGEFSFIFRSVAPSGQVRYLRVQGKTTLSPDKQPHVIQGVAHDITKETEIDHAKSEFVSLASHQLKTPLTAIRWLSEAFLNGPDGGVTSEQREYAKKVADENQRMIDTVNDLLNVSRLELGTLPVQLEECDVCELVKSVVEEQQHTADIKKIAIQTICAPNVPPIHADKNLTRMIIQNLISNAVKYTQDNGSVECEVALSGLHRDKIFLRITDTGIGIPKEAQDRVFERLHRASNARAFAPDGTGLGLYIVKMIVDKAGGNISFESIENKGTTFFISLPIEWRAAAQDMQHVG